ncbi:MAG TPA: DUF1080 domain-containing protein [Bryobacteraceae bacterium]|nr:DUF1080 domain-containing protein [Bryobacteraceae bacterium]
MRSILILLCAAMSLAAAENRLADKFKSHKYDWFSIFDGSTLEGWKANEHPESWSVKDGAIRGDGDASHLFYMDSKCVNCEFQADVKINHGGNSGMYFRTAFGPGFPAGYEAQVNSSHSDPVRTGSLYNFVNITDVLVPDDTWFHQHIIVDGNHIQIFVNDKKVVDFVDTKNTYTSGYLALQEHNKGTVVEFKNISMRELPGPTTPLVGTWKLNRAQSTMTPGEPPTELVIRIEDERTGLRYQSESATADGQKHAANFFGRTDGYDYAFSGSPAYDHISIEETNSHHVHDVMHMVKLRKKIDERVYIFRTKQRSTPVGEAVYYLSPDRNTLTREGTTKHENGEVVKYKEVLERVE